MSAFQVFHTNVFCHPNYQFIKCGISASTNSFSGMLPISFNSLNSVRRFTSSNPLMVPAMKKLFLIISLLGIIQMAHAQLSVCRLFSDHAILQRQKPIPVWGWATPNETVTVMLAGKTLRTRAGDDGAWRVSFPAMEAYHPASSKPVRLRLGQPLRLTFIVKDTPLTRRCVR